MIRDLFRTPTSGLALLYHDIVPPGDMGSSGFVTDGSWRYKVAPERFNRHLSAIDDSGFKPALVNEDHPTRPLYLTFDDGGRTAMEAARQLETYGYRGHFFIVVDRVGDTGFLNWAQIQDLDDRGHYIGSHTMTHANLLFTDDSTRQHELTASKAAIAAELGHCRSISIPFGAYDERVVEAAHEAGYEYVFTSEPVRITPEYSRFQFGRWNVWHDTTYQEVAAILEASPLVVLRTVFRWHSVKQIKRLLGYNRFIRLRDALT